MSWREFCSDWWLEKADRLTADWAGGVPVNWYANPVVWDCGLFSMDAGHAEAQRAQMGERFVSFAGPSPTPTDLNHLYHLWKAGGVEDRSVLEWGGGFGNTARIALTAGVTEYYIADIPIMSELQRRFLVDPVAVTVEPGWLAYRRSFAPDLFLAAFSLDECTTAAHDFVFEQDWFGASTVLIVAQTVGKEDLFPDGPSLVARLRAAGFTEEPAMQENASYFRLVR